MQSFDISIINNVPDIIKTVSIERYLTKDLISHMAQINNALTYTTTDLQFGMSAQKSGIVFEDKYLISC